MYRYQSVQGLRHYQSYVRERDRGHLFKEALIQLRRKSQVFTYLKPQSASARNVRHPSFRRWATRSHRPMPRIPLNSPNSSSVSTRNPFSASLNLARSKINATNVNGRFLSIHNPWLISAMLISSSAMIRPRSPMIFASMRATQRTQRAGESVVVVWRTETAPLQRFRAGEYNSQCWRGWNSCWWPHEAET